MRIQSCFLGIVTILGGCMASEGNDGFEDLAELALDEDEVDDLTDHARHQQSGPYGVLLFDRTGSMSVIRSATGNSRCEDAKTMARGAILEFFSPIVNGSGLAIWGFRTSGSYADDIIPTSSTGYFTNAADALAVIDGLSCSGSTPLADAMCKGLAGDGETLTLSPPPNRMIVLTDGYENTSNGPCSGASGGTFTAGTWQNKVLMEAISRGIRVDARFWASPTILQMTASVDDLTLGGDAQRDRLDAVREELELIADAEDLPAATMDALMNQVDATQSTCDQACQELLFFTDVTAFTGGVVGVVSDDNPNYPAQDAVDPPSGPVPPPGSGGGIWW